MNHARMDDQSNKPKFHIVNRETAPDQPTISTGIATDTWRFALYRRVEGFVHGELVALLHDETEANLICCSLNAVTSFLNTLFKQEESNDKPEDN